MHLQNSTIPEVGQNFVKLITVMSETNSLAVIRRWDITGRTRNFYLVIASSTGTFKWIENFY
jgi:hypothetical protein